MNRKFPASLRDEDIEVILIDKEDNFLGTGYKLEVHRAGRLHRAFSVILYNEFGQMLIQRRSMSKYHSPGKWANSCCGHPFVDESPQMAAQRRMQEELGFSCGVNFKTKVTYFLNVDHGMIEHEFVHIFNAIVPAITFFKINLEEVMDLKWLYPSEVLADVMVNPHSYTRWFRLYLLKYYRNIF